MIPLHRLLDALPGASVQGSVDVAIAAVVHDSRQVVPGSLFVAVPSVERRDGGETARHVLEAVRKGAVAVALQDGIEVEGATLIRVPDARGALADLAAAFFGHPSRQLRLYGVTGTDGKSTTTYLLEQVFAAAGYPTGLIGTVEIKIGDRRLSNRERMTTPEAPELQRLLREMVEAGVTHAVMEVSSHGIALQRVRCCSFTACALTNITADHIEFHGTWEEYFETKMRLFTALASGRPAVLNRDDAHFPAEAARVSGPLTTYGLSPEADLYAWDLTPLDRGTRCWVRRSGERAQLTVPLRGRFNVSNALAAAGLALIDGLGLSLIGDAIARAQAPPGRLQRIEAGQPFEVLVDYAHTMHAFRSVLGELRHRTPAPHRLIAVFGATGDRDRAKRPVLAQIAREYADFFIITNEDPYGERPEDIIAEVATGAPKVEEGERFLCETDRGRAIERAIGLAQDGDTVVILGKGHEQSMVVNGEKQGWSDLAAARRALERVS